MEQAKIPERYTLIEEVGQGGMAVVYRAQDETLKREVAIKVLHQHLAAEPESKARLEREAQAVAKLRHDNILEIFDYSGLDSQSAYIVTEFIDGQTLKQFLSGAPLRHPEIAALIAIEVCGALAHAHGVGVLHRDVKPENVMVRKDGLLKLMDFGIAQVLDLERMTVTGQLLGSPAYMAPEIVEGKQLDFRTDVFSVGIMLYLLATGSLPFSGKNPHEVLRRITEGKFPDPRAVGRGVDQALSRIITRALARRPEDRYADVGPLADELRALPGRCGAGRRARRAARVLRRSGRLRGGAAAAAGRGADGGARRATVGEARRRRRWSCGTASSRSTRRTPPSRPRCAGWRDARACRWPGSSCASAALVAGRRLVRREEAGAPGRREVAPRRSRRLAAGAARAARAAGGRRRRPSRAPARDGRRPARPSCRRSGRVRGAPPPRAARRRRPPAPPVSTRAGRRRARSRSGRRPRTSTSISTASASSATTWTTRRSPSPGRACTYSSSAAPSNCCFVERVEVGPEQPLPADSIIARRLKWRPAHLVVTTDPPSATTRVLVRDPAPRRRDHRRAPGRGDRHPVLRRRRFAARRSRSPPTAGDAFASERAARPRRPAPQTRREAQGGAAAG